MQQGVASAGRNPENHSIVVRAPYRGGAIELAIRALDQGGVGLVPVRACEAVERCQMMRPDIESLLIVGAGPIGLGVLAMAKIILGRQLKVLIADVIPYRLKLAEDLGGQPVNVSKTPLRSGIQGGDLMRVDMAVDTSGKQSARQEAVNLLAPRGSLICVGHGEGIALQISPDIITPERSIVGSEYFRYDELPTNLRRLRQHRAYLNQIITHRMGVDEIQRAFEAFFFGGETGKVVIEQ